MLRRLTINWHRFTSMTFPTRAETLALMHEFTASESLRKHMLAVEGAMRAYAQKFGEDEDRWGTTGLITTSITSASPTTPIRRPRSTPPRE